METLTIEYQPIETTKTAAANPKAHDIATIKASLSRFGFCELPAVNERTGRLVAGHGRREALLELQAAGDPPPANIRVGADGKWLWPVLRGHAFKNATEADAYLVASNNTTIAGGWDTSKLAKLLDGIRTKGGAELTGTGFTSRALDRMLSKAQQSREVKEVDLPDLPKAPVTRVGDIWTLGEHVVVCGDCRDSTVMARLMGKLLADLVSADPPYGMGKEKDGVVGDNQYGAKLDQFQVEWWSTARGVMRETAAAYVWGNPLDLWRWWFGALASSEELTFRNEIVWNKGGGHGQRAAAHLQYATATERALFFALGHQGLGHRNQSRYWDGWDPLRLYLKGEIDSLGLKTHDVNQLTGTTNMFQHWFSRSQWAMIPEEAYTLLQQATGGFPRSYAQLKSEHEKLRLEFERQLTSERAYHDNTHSAMTDVWDFPRVSGGERYGHATPKPVLLVTRQLLTSCPVGGVVLAPFGGTGPEVLAAEQTGRKARVVELQPAYVDVIVERWQQLTGAKATRGVG